MLASLGNKVGRDLERSGPSDTHGKMPPLARAPSSPQRSHPLHPTASNPVAPFPLLSASRPKMKPLLRGSLEPPCGHTWKRRSRTPSPGSGPLESLSRWKAFERTAPPKIDPGSLRSVSPRGGLPGGTAPTLVSQGSSAPRTWPSHDSFSLGWVHAPSRASLQI